MNIFSFIHLCWRLWRDLKSQECVYLALETHYVPVLCVFAARDREAWRVAQYALETGLVRK